LFLREVSAGFIFDGVAWVLICTTLMYRYWPKVFTHYPTSILTRQPTHHFIFLLTPPSTHPILMEIGPKRRKKAELSPEQRSAIIHAYKNGISQSKLADNFSCTRKTIYNTLKRFKEHKSI
jgi:hypothetical protein